MNRSRLLVPLWRQLAQRGSHGSLRSRCRWALVCLVGVLLAGLVTGADTAAATGAYQGGLARTSLASFADQSASPLPSYADYPLKSTGGRSYQPIAYGDLRGNGREDLVVAGSEGVNVLLGNGDGTFEEPVTYDTSEAFHDVAVGHLLGQDKPLDIIGTNDPADTVTILPGQGDGTFGTPIVIAIPPADGSSAVALAVGDLAKNGVDDFVVGTDTGIVPFINDGAGHFTAATFEPWVGQDNGRIANDYNLAIGDVNGDGYPDIVSGGIFHEGGGFCGSCAGADLFLNDRSGGFESASYIALGNDYRYYPKVVLTHLTESSGADLVAVDSSDNSCTAGLVTVDVNGGGAISGPPTTYGPNCAHDIAAADMNADGSTDVITVGQGCFSCSSHDGNGVIDLGDGSGTLAGYADVATEGFSDLIATDSLLDVPAVVVTDGSTLRIVADPLDVSPNGDAVIAGTATNANGGHVQACPTSGGPCRTTRISGGAAGGFFLLVPDGSYTVTIFPPAGSPDGPKTVGPISVPSQEANLNVSFSPPGSLPEGVSLSSPGRGGQENTVPGLNWGEPSTLTVSGCKGGFGLAYVHGTNTSTGQSETRAFPLDETPAGSGTYVAQIPPLAPLHGEASVRQSVACPGKSQVLPDGGSPSGGTSVLIAGSGLTGATGVRFGSSQASSFAVLQDDLIEAAAPAGSAGTSVPISVTTASGSTVVVGSFEYFGVTSLSTNSGSASGGDTVTIRGSGFDNVRGVVFGLVPSPSVSVVNSEEIVAQAPPGVGTVDVQVLNGFAASKAVTADFYSYQGGPPGSSGISEGVGATAPETLAAQISSLCEQAGSGPISGLGAACQNAQDQLTGLFGAGPIGVLFQTGVTAAVAGVACIFGGCEAAIAGAGIGFVAYELNQIACGVGHCLFNLLIDPSGTVLDTHGSPIEGAAATLLEGSAASGPFAEVEPQSGVIEPAENPEKTGASGQFDWNALAGTYEVEASAQGCHAPGEEGQPDVFTSPFSLPPPAIGLMLTLECVGGTPPTPRVTGLSVPGGSTTGGNVVDILGEGLADVTAVHFAGNVSVHVQPLSPYAVAAVAPAGISGTVDVTVSGPGGTSATTEGDHYTYSTPVVSEEGPVVESVAPNNGPLSGGTVVAIKGNHLDGAYAVEFGDTPSIQLTPISGSEVEAVAPAAAFASRLDVTVMTSAGSSAPTLVDGFVYGSPAPPLSTAVSLGASPGTPLVGQPVSVTAIVAPTDGGGTVAFYADGSTAPVPSCGARALKLAGSSDQTNCTIAGLTAGAHSISASYSGDASYAGSVGSTNLSIVEPPPPNPVSGGVSLARSTITVKGKGEAAIKLSCAGSSTCGGTLTLAAKSTPKKGKKKHSKTETIGTANFSIPAVGTSTVMLRLSPIGRALLRAAHGHLSARLTILEMSPNSSKTKTEAVHLVQQKEPKAKKG
jgi:Bacterial Ig-like domain (group 3)/IPT/TIG domain/FG-GAP-like repeat